MDIGTCTPYFFQLVYIRQFSALIGSRVTSKKKKMNVILKHAISEERNRRDQECRQLRALVQDLESKFLPVMPSFFPCWEQFVTSIQSRFLLLFKTVTVYI